MLRTATPAANPLKKGCKRYATLWQKASASEQDGMRMGTPGHTVLACELHQAATIAEGAGGRPLLQLGLSFTSQSQGRGAVAFQMQCCFCLDRAAGSQADG